MGLKFLICHTVIIIVPRIRDRAFKGQGGTSHSGRCDTGASQMGMPEGLLSQFPMTESDTTHYIMVLLLFSPHRTGPAFSTKAIKVHSENKKWEGLVSNEGPFKPSFSAHSLP